MSGALGLATAGVAALLLVGTPAVRDAGRENGQPPPDPSPQGGLPMSDATPDRALAAFTLETPIGRVGPDSICARDLDAVRLRARRLLEVHPLAAADALHLAASLVLVEERTQGVGFVSLDERLREAAGREGFAVLP